MIKENVEIKNALTVMDIANIVEYVSDYIISKDENGAVIYMPYLKPRAMMVALADNALNGLTFEKNDNVYDAIVNDKEISTLLDNILSDYSNIDVSGLSSYIDDVVEFRKKQYLHNEELDKKMVEILQLQKQINEMNLKIASKQNKLLDQQIKANDYMEKVAENMSPEMSAKLQEKLASGELDIQKFVDTTVQSYLQSDVHRSKQDELIAAQQDKIADLSKYKAMHDARNTLADK